MRIEAKSGWPVSGQRRELRTVKADLVVALGLGIGKTPAAVLKAWWTSMMIPDGSATERLPLVNGKDGEGLGSVVLGPTRRMLAKKRRRSPSRRPAADAQKLALGIEDFAGSVDMVLPGSRASEHPAPRSARKSRRAHPGKFVANDAPVRPDPQAAAQVGVAGHTVDPGMPAEVGPSRRADTRLASLPRRSCTCMRRSPSGKPGACRTRSPVIVSSKAKPGALCRHQRLATWANADGKTGFASGRSSVRLPIV